MKFVNENTELNLLGSNKNLSRFHEIHDCLLKGLIISLSSEELIFERIFINWNFQKVIALSYLYFIMFCEKNYRRQLGRKGYNLFFKIILFIFKLTNFNSL